MICEHPRPATWPRCRPCDRKAKRADRRAQPGGVYLAVLKLASGRFIIKVGHTGAIRSKAGRLASQARFDHDFAVEWAEIVRYLPLDDYHERVDTETRLVHHFRLDAYDETREYFWPGIYPEVVALMGERALPFERRSTAARQAQFLEYLHVKVLTNPVAAL